MRLLNKVGNYERALLRLKEAVVEYRENKDHTLIRDGLIQRFEFTYELSWKTTKQFLEDNGITDLNSPRAVFKEGWAQKLITNEYSWLQMIKDRNLTSHVYNDDIAREIAERISVDYVKEFESLLMIIKTQL